MNWVSTQRTRQKAEPREGSRARKFPAGGTRAGTPAWKAKEGPCDSWPQGGRLLSGPLHLLHDGTWNWAWGWEGAEQ